MPVNLHKSDQALGHYLDEMLRQATTEFKQGPVVESSPSAPTPEQWLLPKIDPDSRSDSEGEIDLSEMQAPHADSPSDRLRHTVEFPLQALMFVVGGHQLSIPLVQLGSVVIWNDSITRLPESPDWLLGLIKYRDARLRIVDSPVLLNIRRETNAKPGHLLVLGEGNWAITCDHLGEVVNLEYDDIQWKPGDDGQLVLGTIRDSLSSLLNPASIVRLLNQCDGVPFER